MLLLIALMLPIWRSSLHPKEGLWVWEYYQDVHSQEYYDSHIPYEQAVAEAQEAYAQCTSRINRRQY